MLVVVLKNVHNYIAVKRADIDGTDLKLLTIMNKM